MTTQENKEVGIPIGDDEVQLLKRYREIFLVDSRIKAQDDFAKWLFGLTATIAALGVGFSNAAISTLKGEGILAFGIAVLLAGLGLASATYALSVNLPDANWQSLDDMFSKMEAPLRKKRIGIRIASIFLALALVASASAPLLSSLISPTSSNIPNITFSIANNLAECSFSSNKLKKGSRFSLNIFGVYTDNQMVCLSAISEVVGPKQRANIITPKLTIPINLVTLRIIGRFTLDLSDSKEDMKEEKIDLKNISNNK